MRNQSLLPLTALCLCCIAASVSAADKAEKADAVRITKLVEQLGNDDFNEREKASAALDGIGEPALDALRQAMRSTDEEVGKRAETLVGKIEKRQETATALKAKRVHLVYKDAAVKDALEDFAKQSGYHFALNDPENKLKDRTITIDTGDAPFWQALDQFCERARLKEVETREPAPAPGGAFPQPVINSEQHIINSEQHITLTDGQAESRPTDAASAVRVRVEGLTNPSQKAIYCALQLTLEPRLQWGTVEKVTVTKAVDDQKHELIQLADPTPAAPLPPGIGVGGLPPGFVARGGGMPVAGAVGSGSIHQEALFRLKEGEQVSKSLAELSGTVSASILTEATPVITVPDILKAAGKTFKGGDNGQLKVVEVTKDANGQITLRVELQAPANIVPQGGLIGFRGMRRLGRGVPVAVPPGGLVAVRGAVFVGGVGSSAGGLNLLDDKGETVKLTGVQMQFTPVVAGAAGIVNSLQHVLTFQAEKGQEPAKLIYSGRKLLNLEIPFMLRDAPLP
jgi:hypothetical protein